MRMYFATGSSALLAALAFPPFRVSVAPFVAYLLFAVVLERLVRDESTGASPFGLGVLWGSVSWSVLLPWTWAALANTPVLGFLAYLALVGCFAVAHGCVAVSIVWLRRRLRVPLIWAFPVGWIAGEWLRGHLGPFAFPWLPIAAGLTEWPSALGLARWTGASGVGFWVLMPQALVAAWLVRPGRGGSSRRASWVVGAAVIGGWLGLPLLIPSARVATEDTRSLVVLQPNVEAFGDPRSRALEVIAWSRARLEDLDPRDSASADLVLLPEGAVPVDVARSPTIVDSLAALSRLAGAPLLFGGWARAPSGEVGSVSNAAFVVDAEGLRQDLYRKRRLVPATEWIPFNLGGRGVTPGQAPGVFEIAGVRWGLLICYESIFPRAALDLLDVGADVIVNLSNDAWYGRPGAGRLGLSQHPAHAILRAVETGHPVVRAANTGPSFLVDAGGRVSERTQIGGPAVARIQVPVTPIGASLFSRTGDLVGPVCLGFLLLAWGISRLGERREPRQRG